MKSRENVSAYCKLYRESKNIPLTKFQDEIKYQTINSFEKGLSGSISMLKPYLILAEEHNELDVFLMNLSKLITDENAEIKYTVV